MHRTCVLWTLIAACSGGDSQATDAAVDAAPQGQPCGAPGMLNGTVMGQQVTVVRASAGLKAMTLASNPGSCTDQPQPDSPILVLEYCATPTKGAHTIASPLSGWPGCNGSNLGATVEQSTNPMFKYVATGGTVTVIRSDATCVDGTFTIEFGSEQITGA